MRDPEDEAWIQAHADRFPSELRSAAVAVAERLCDPVNRAIILALAANAPDVYWFGTNRRVLPSDFAKPRRTAEVRS